MAFCEYGHMAILENDFWYGRSSLLEVSSSKYNKLWSWSLEVINLVKGQWRDYRPEYILGKSHVTR